MTGGRLSAEINAHQGTVNSVCFSPDGTRVASASYDKTCRIFEPDGREVARFSGHEGPVLTCAFSPDGTKIATTSMDRTLRIFNVADGELTMKREFEAGITCAVFSPDGHHLVLGGDGRCGHMFSLAMQSAMYSIRGHTGAVHSVAFSTDGKFVAAGSADGTASVWNAGNGDAVAATPKSGEKDTHTDEVTGVAFDAAGKQIITTSDDCTVRVWTLPEEALQAHTSHMMMEEVD